MITPTIGGVRVFRFNQTTPATTWNIYHGFGVEPIIDVNAYDDNGVLQKAFPLNITQVDVNNSQITWTTARAGIATLAATPASNS